MRENTGTVRRFAEEFTQDELAEAEAVSEKVLSTLGEVGGDATGEEAVAATIAYITSGDSVLTEATIAGLAGSFRRRNPLANWGETVALIAYGYEAGRVSAAEAEQG